jgi:hypothetical protein
MLTKTLARSIESADQRLVLLAPPSTVIPPAFDNIEIDPARHADLLMQMQRLRGSIYLHDGALGSQELSVDGRHQTPEDDRSWHMLMVDESGRVKACIWYMEHAPHSSSVDRLRLKNCPLIDDPTWRDTVRAALEHDMETAQREGVGYAEAGGWAVAKDNGCISEGLVLALGCFSLARALGDALCVSTATVRHCSSTILRRLGGGDLRADGQMIPTYYDSRYKCEMELLRFDSRYPSAKYAGFVEALRQRLTSAQLFVREPQQVMSTSTLRLEAAAPRLRVAPARFAAA